MVDVYSLFFFSSKGMSEEAPAIFVNNSHGVSFIKIIM